MRELDAIDRQIIRHLQADGRISNADLAAKVNLSPSSCLRRMRQLELDGVISGYVALISQEAVGRGNDVFVSITLERQNEEALDAFEAAARACPDVMECYLMTGGSDYLLRVAVADSRDYERIHKQFLSRLPHVARITSSFALRTVSKRTSLPLD